MTSIPKRTSDAGVEYDFRAKQVPMLTELGGKQGTVNGQDLAQAKAARLAVPLPTKLFKQESAK